MTDNSNQPTNRVVKWMKTSITAQMIIVGVLILLLLIPLTFVKDLIDERSTRQVGVVQEINEKWGNQVEVYGPILKVPYAVHDNYKKNKDGTVQANKGNPYVNYFYLFPEKLKNNCKADSKKLKRGNFESSVFTAKMDFSGSFVFPNIEDKGIEKEDILWEKASIEVRTTNLKGIKNELFFKIDGKSFPFEASSISQNNSRQDYYTVLKTNYLGFKDSLVNKEKPFSFSMTFNGSQKVTLIPVGKTTEMGIKSNWKDPSFMGNYLPNDETKKISKEGFEAEWKVLHINRAFSQVHLGKVPSLESFAFGTEFMVMVDEYQKSQRSIKYGLLVIALTFLVFFLVQIINSINIHPLQYLLIGLALVMFYTLLISISEHSNFLSAYLVAGVAVISLIGLYTKSVLKKPKFAVLISISLATIYSFIYVIIQLESYALLSGSIGLFCILAAVMFVSRKIDWKNE